MHGRRGLDQIGELCRIAQVGDVIRGADTEFAQFQVTRVDRCGIVEAIQHGVATLCRHRS